MDLGENHNIVFCSLFSLSHVLILSVMVYVHYKAILSQLSMSELHNRAMASSNMA